jgi:diguanylate cyclase (GGDEF)-like protein
MDLACQQVAHTYERTRPNGTVLEVRGMPLEGGGFVTTSVDATAQRQSQATVAHLAYHDPLTDLPNRILLQDRLEQAVARAKRGEQIAVHYFDLDRFKQVNDHLGHAVGDTLLKAVAGRLKTITRQTDTIARIGGDEFVLIQSALAQESNASALARRAIDVVSNSYDIDNRRITIGASVGIAVAPRHGTDATMLLRKADAALYRCKADGRGTFAFFD